MVVFAFVLVSYFFPVLLFLFSLLLLPLLTTRGSGAVANNHRRCWFLWSAAKMYLKMVEKAETI